MHIKSREVSLASLTPLCQGLREEEDEALCSKLEEVLTSHLKNKEREEKMKEINSLAAKGHEGALLTLLGQEACEATVYLKNEGTTTQVTLMSFNNQDLTFTVRTAKKKEKEVRLWEWFVKRGKGEYHCEICKQTFTYLGGGKASLWKHKQTHSV